MPSPQRIETFAMLDRAATRPATERETPPADSWQKILLLKLAEGMEHQRHVCSKNVSNGYSTWDTEIHLSNIFLRVQQVVTTLEQEDDIDHVAPESLLAWLTRRCHVIVQESSYHNPPGALYYLNGDIKYATSLADHAKPGWRVARHLELLSSSSEVLVPGTLNLTDTPTLTRLPRRLTVEGDLILSRCTNLAIMPEELSLTGNLELDECNNVRLLPRQLDIPGNIKLSFCSSLEQLAEAMVVGGHLHASSCLALVALPHQLEVGGDMNVTNCPILTTPGKTLSVGGRLEISQCGQLTGLGEKVTVGGPVRLSECPLLSDGMIGGNE